jgi:hypothetical protein
LRSPSGRRKARRVVTPDSVKRGRSWGPSAALLGSARAAGGVVTAPTVSAHLGEWAVGHTTGGLPEVACALPGSAPSMRCGRCSPRWVAPPGSDVRSFMGLVSLAQLFVMRVTAMQGQNLRAGDLALRTERGRTWVTLHRVLGKTARTDARGTATVQENTSAGRRISQLLGTLHRGAAAARGAAGAPLVRAPTTGSRPPGDPWTVHG